MTIQLYRNISDAYEEIEAKEGKSIKDILPDLDFTQYAIIVNGQYTEATSYIIKEKDIILIRNVPEGMTAAIIVGAIAVTASLAVGIVAGVQAYEQRKEYERVMAELEQSQKSVSTSRDVTQNPSIKGASNSVATGKTQPYILGTHLFTPYILNGGKASYKGYHTIGGKDGENQYYNVVLEGGFGKQIVDHINIGDLKVLNCREDTPQEGVYHSDVLDTWASRNSVIEFAQDGQPFEKSFFNQKIVETSVNTQLYQGNEDNYKPLIYSLEDNAMSANIEIMFNGLCHYDSNGNKTNKTRNIIPSYSLDYNKLLAEGDSNPEENATWTNFSFRQANPSSGKYELVDYATYSYTFQGCAESLKRYEKFRYSNDEAIAKARAALYSNLPIWDSPTMTGGTKDLRSNKKAVFSANVVEEKRRETWWGTVIKYYKYTVYMTLKTYDFVEDSETYTQSNTFTKNSSKQLRYVAHVDLPFNDIFELDEDTEEYKRKTNYPPAIRLISNDNKSSSGSDVCTCYLEWYQSECFDLEKTIASGQFVKEKIIGEKEAALSTLIGIHIKATEQNKGQLDKISVVSSGVARTWDTEEQEWSTTKTATSNPAAWMLEILTSDKHTPSQIKSEEEEEQIDLEALGAWYEDCETAGYSINYVITEGMTKKSLMELILKCGRGVAYRNIYGQISFAFDSEIDNAIGIINEQNIISLSYDKEVKRSPDGIVVNYINSDAEYQKDSFIVMYNQYDSEGNFDPYGKNRSSDCVLKEIDATGFTSWFDAYRYALYLMRCERLRPKIVTAKVGEEGIFYSPMSKILLQHSSLKIGLGNAEIKAVVINSDNKIIGLDLYDEVTLTTDKTYNIIIQCVGSDYCTPLIKELSPVDSNGKYSSIYFTEPIEATASVIPHAGDILSYGYGADTVTSPMLITGVTPNDNGYELTLVDYNADIFDMGDEIEDYKSNITQPQADIATLPTDMPSASYDDLQNAVAGITSGTIEVGNPDTPTFTAKASKDGISLVCNPFGEGLKNDISKIMWYMSKADDADWTLLTSSGDKSYTYIFDRAKDGYPEKTDFANWSFKAKAVNSYGGYSESSAVSVDTSSYGTWLLTKPTVLSRVSDRTITLIVNPSSRSDNLEVYGTVRYKIQVRKPGTDTSGAYYKPASSLDPYISESNYKDGTGYIISDGVYSQTMPLTGQSTNSIVDTLYEFKITAFNESSSVECNLIEVTALCTSIRDIVKANQTVKDSYIENLTALCSAFGFISGGLNNGLVTDYSNYWTLNNGVVANNENNIAYKGAFRIGGDNEYLLVKPIVTNGQITSYSIDFKVGNFQVTSQASLFEGEFNVQDNTSLLDRVKISPKGIFLQHRDSKNSSWYTINQFDTSGVIAPSLKAKSQMIIGNAKQSATRNIGHDIGRAYLSSDALVWHFDDNYYSQNGNMSGLTLDGIYELKGSADSNGIDFTPAIYAVAPYCTEAKCIYGQYSMAYTLSDTQTATIDFWMQYLYAEAQELFNIGTANDKLICQVIPSECEAVVSAACSWVYNGKSYKYTSTRNPKIGDYVYNSLDAAETGGETSLVISGITKSGQYDVATITVSDKVYNFESGSPDAIWESYAPETVWGEDSCLALRANNKKTSIIHQGQANKEEIILDDYNYSFLEYDWEHIGVVFKESKIKFLFDDFVYEFTRYSQSSDDISVSLNSTKTSIIIDELYIDTEIELTADFKSQTENRIPWASLSKSENWFVLDADDPSKTKSNILDYFFNQFLESDSLKNKIKNIMSE